MKSFDEWWEESYMMVSADKTEAENIYNLGQQSKQAEVDELQKRIDELEGKNKILGMRLDVIQGVMQKEIELIVQLKGDQS